MTHDEHAINERIVMSEEEKDIRDEHREWMSPMDVAEWLGISRTKVYELIYDASIRSYRIGTRRLIRRSDLLVFLESHAYGEK